MPIRMSKTAAAAIALTLGMTLSACATSPTNRSLNSVKQPVVQRTNYTLDVSANSAGLSIPEQQRLDAWFEAMDLGYGDRVSIDDPVSSAATKDAIAKIAGRYGVLLSDGAPVTPGYVQPGQARVVVSRSSASVPGCPDWEGRGNYNYENATNAGFGCAVNGNLAAMVADPEDLVQGKEGDSETVVMTSNKAIDSYRSQTPTGEKGLKSNATGGGS